MKNIYLSGFTFLLIMLLALDGLTSEIGNNEKVGQSSNSAVDQQIIYCSNEDTFLVVWTNNNSGVDQIYYNFLGDGDLDPGGTLLSSISSGPYPYAEKPQIAYDASTSTAGVVYTESNAPGRDSIMLSFIDVVSGTILGSYSVGTENTWNMSATIASDNAGHFLVAFYDTTSQNISAKFYDNTGEEQWATLTLGSVPSGYLLPYSIDIAYNAAEAKFLVVWTDGNDNLYSRTVETNGTLSSTLNYGQIDMVGNPALAYGPSTNEFFIVYDNYFGDVNGFLTDGSGNKSGIAFTFGNTGKEAFPDVTYNSAVGSFAITWQEYLGNAGIWIQEYLSGDCANLGDSVKLDNISATSNTPAVAFDQNAENYWVTWTGSVSGLDEIYLQRFNSELNTTKAICKDITVYLDEQGQYILQASEIDDGSHTLCSIPILSVSMDTLTCAEMPFADIDLIASDGNGNTDTCTARITILDTISPTASCVDLDVYLDDAGQATITAAEVDGGSSDNCEISSIAFSPVDFTCADLGDNTVTLTITDANENTNTCTANVTVRDTTPPEITCPPDISVSNYADLCGAFVSFTASATDNCAPDVTFTYSINSGSLFPVGTTQVTVTATDDAGNSSTCTFDVTVNDTEAPTISASQNGPFANDPGMCSFKNGPGDVTFSVGDNCNGEVNIREIGVSNGDTVFDVNFDLVQASYYQGARNYPVGTTELTLIATDASGNQSETSVIIVVDDEEDPIAVCQDITVELGSSGDAGITAADVDGGSSDNCGIASMSLDKSSFSCSDIGDNTVTLYVSDAAGNIDSCKTTVTVIDNYAPSPICINGLTVELGADGTVNLQPTDFIASPVTDNCGGPVTYSLSKSIFTCEDIGTNIVRVYATDESGNSDYCETYFLLQNNNFSLTVDCKDTTIALDETGLASLTAADVDNGSSTNCGIDNMILSQYDFNCNNLGDNIVTLYVSDLSGNMDSCRATVSVIDTIAPVAVCKNISIGLNANGTASIKTGQLDGGSTDNCGIDTMYLDRYNFTSADIGNAPVTLFVKDASGNTSSCTAVVTVGDNKPPKVICNFIGINLDEQGNHVFTDEELLALTEGTTDNLSAPEDLLIDATIMNGTIKCDENGIYVFVIVSATDEYNNTGTCSRWLKVLNGFERIVDPINDIEEIAPAGVCEMPVNYPEISTDGTCAQLSLVSGLGPDGMFPIGTTEEIWLLSNNGGDSLFISFNVIIMPGDNRPPTLDPIADADITGSVSEVIVPLSGISYGADCVEQDIVLTASGINSEIVSDISVNYTSPEATGELILGIPSNAVGSDTITVTVEDSEGGSVSQTFVVTIDYTNQAPVLMNAIADQELNADKVLKIPFNDSVFVDNDGDLLLIQFALEDNSALPAWLDIMNDTLYATPSIADTGCVNVVITATDPSMASVSDTFRICVNGFIVGIGNNNFSELNLNMYPNPSKGEVTLEFYAPINGDIELMVSDITGKRVLSKTYRTGQRIDFDLSDQVSGMYFVNIRADGQNYMRKLVLNKR